MIRCLCHLIFFCVVASLLSLLCSYALAGPYVVPTPNEDTIRRFKPRMVLMLTDTSEQAQLERTKLFYERIKNKFYRRNLTRELYDLLVTNPRPVKAQSSWDANEAIEYFRQYEGKVIQEITLTKLPVFGRAVNDSTQSVSDWLKKAGNAVHFQTRSWVLRKNLLFQEGELVDAEALYDNERLLRKLSSIRDARIKITPIADNPDAVAVEVITQDVFPLSFSAGRSDFSSYTLGIQNNNVFGFGHKLISEGIYRSDGSPALGYAGTYVVENVQGTFINAAVHGAYSDIRLGGGFSLDRPFFTPDIRWAGGLELQRMHQLNYVLHRDPQKDTLVRSSHDKLDAWAGYAIALNDKRLHPKGRESIVLAGRGMRISHHQTPGGELQNNDFFLDRKLLLSSVGWVRRRYRRDAYIYGFGRTEDVPLGALANVTVGFEQQNRSNLYYWQLNSAWGTHLERYGYLDARIAIGQYFGNGNSASRRIRFGSINWISKLIPSGRYRLRQLIHLNYIKGVNRHSYEFVAISNNEVRGLRGVDLRGTQRLTASFETIAFSPIQIVGFRLAAFAFADVAILNEYKSYSLQGNDFQGYGLGFRVRNENLVFKTFQLRFSYYPGSDGGFGISLLGSPSFGFQDYMIGKPQVHPYR